MATWKKVITEQDNLSSMDAVDSGTVNAPGQNTTLIFDGTSWQAAAAGTTYNFEILTFANDSFNSSTYLQGVVNAGFEAATNFTATYANKSGDLDQAADVAISGDTSASQALTCDMGVDGNTSQSLNVLYPTDGWTSGTNQLTFKLTAEDGSVEDTKQFSTYFANYKAWGIDAAETLDGTGTDSGDVFGLDTIDGAVDQFATTSYALPTQSSVAGTGYIHYCYPARISGTPVFWISNTILSFDLVSSTLDVTNTAGYTEPFKHWRSPQSYTSADNTFQVT